MHLNAQRNLLRLANLLEHPFAKAVRDGLNDGNEAAFYSTLEAAGYQVVDSKLKVRHQVEIFLTGSKEPILVAKGISDSPEDALLQAIHGYLKELEQSLSKE